MKKSQEEFWCPYCKEWLVVDGTVHEPAHHHDNEEIDDCWPTRFRLVTVTETGEEIVVPGDEQERAERADQRVEWSDENPSKLEDPS